MKRIFALLLAVAPLFTFGQIDTSFYEGARLINLNPYANEPLRPTEYSQVQDRAGLLLYRPQDSAVYFNTGSQWLELLQIQTDGISLESADSLSNYVATAKRDSATGWENYTDTTYTSANPFTLTANDTVRFPLSCGSVINSQGPLGGQPMFDCTDSSIVGRNGDGIIYTIDFVAKPTSPSTTTLDVWIDIGGGVGILYDRLSTFPKGQNIERTIVVSTAAYTLDTWEANGGKIYIVANGACEIYNMRILLHRIHVAR